MRNAGCLGEIGRHKLFLRIASARKSSGLMITFFTTAKPFTGHNGVIQRNALESWALIHPDVEVILFGDEEGAPEVCAELGLRHEPNVERHESGLKYVRYLFGEAQRLARHDYMCYLNCDIILLKDFLDAFERVR